MGAFIVSFCNVKTGGCLAAYMDPAAGVSRKLAYGREDITSACGLAQDGERIYSACAAGNASFLATFAKSSLQLLDLVALPGVLDIHSICTDGGTLIAVSTGTDEIVRISPEDPTRTETLWRPNDAGEDIHHLNSVMRYKGNLVCSAFGPKAGERRSSALQGYIYDISAGTLLARGIRQPHSLAERAGVLYYCESARSQLRSLDGMNVPIGGYLRGLACLEDGTCLVGASVARFDSSSPDLVLNPADAGARAGRCAIHVLQPSKPHASRSIDCSHLADEIYDILPL